MKRVRKLMCAIDCGLIIGCFSIVLTMMIAARAFPNGKSGNPVIDYLLRGVSIQTAIPDERWLKEYPFDESSFEVWKERIQTAEGVIDNFCTTSFPEARGISDFVTWLKNNCLYDHLEEIPHLYENRAYIEQPVRNVLQLGAELDEMEIPFLYVQSPQPYTNAFRQGKPVTEKDYGIGERSQYFEELLSASDIEAMFLHEALGEEIRFDASLHWFPEDALRATVSIVERLNQSFRLQIEMDLFDQSCFTNLLDGYPGEREMILVPQDAAFSVPVPCADDRFLLTYAEDKVWEGRFDEVLLTPTEVWKTEAPYYGIFRIGNSQIFDVQNLNSPNQKTILMIGDSYDWPVASYLSLGVARVIFLHNASFHGSILSYIRHIEPDAVVIAYNDAEFWEQYTEDAFDFR